MKDKIVASASFPAQIQERMETDGAITKVIYQIQWSPEDLQTGVKPVISLQWMHPIIDLQYQWYTSVHADRALKADWWGPVSSKISSGAPVRCFYNDAGMNRYTVALDECLTEVQMALGVHEENGELIIGIDVPLDASGKTTEYEFTLWIDETEEPYEETLLKVSQWWEKKYPPMEVPNAVRQPVYSCWYSMHQNVYADLVKRECAKGSELGMRTVIIDDGWQTDDSNRGYGYTGDWNLAVSKIPDMKQLVNDLHEMDMKVLIWFSPPFLGKYSSNAERYKEKTLFYIDNLNCWVLDPRYPEIRQFIIDTYVDAVQKWDLDGLKLDFIDQFSMKENTPIFREGMDYPVLEDGVHRLMVDIMKALNEVRKDILIEFRQAYIGPSMREYGNIFRVSDCPNSTSENRIGMVDLRLLCGSTAVHSDMLMWNPGDRVENAVCQIENVLFTTVQFSARLENSPADHIKAIRFWIQFMKEHQHLLVESPIHAEAPQQLYPVVYTRENGQAIYACYLRNHCIDLDLSDLNEIWLVNANSGNQLLIRAHQKAVFKAEVYSCTGDLVETKDIQFSELTSIPVPECGLVHLYS